ncbi:Cof-type HAD-IIB family hydrolase [Arthrobacter sp. H5]|uniref:Cof-type HAD-IIB family hydrolase n=1 Tax=Arthrobacter sp. H5 TaxID=1267973 RepID=UPI000487F70E|nr:Cof-type HAD-IIB family hydrolase [Arthrobacter sp. H5]
MRLVASDMDGTIVGHDGTISERTVRAFERCRQQGIEVVFVTGRPPRWLEPLRQLEYAGKVICSNGALTYDLGAEKVLSSHLLDSSSIFEARNIIKGIFPAAAFAAETVSGFHVEHGFAEEASLELLGGVRPKPLAESLNGEGVIKFLARERDITPDEFLHEVAPAIEHLVATTHSAPSVAMLEMSVPGINKSVTLAQYAADLGIDASEVVAFGDMPNDIQMLGWAGHGYAMASGHADALAAANLRAPAFDDDGVAQVLEERLAALKSA